MSDKHNQPPFADFNDDAFVGGVLGRTSGAACEKATAQLDGLMAGRLGDLDRQLVQAHLEHCAGCRQLAVTMGWLTPLLPRMVEIDPGPEFLAGVLARTTGVRLPAPLGLQPMGLAGLMDRVGRWWERQIIRPQFALQAAYIATVLLVLLTYAPGAPLRSVPQQALEVITAGPQGMPVIGLAVARASNWLDTRGAAAVDSGRQRAQDGWNDWRDELSRRTLRTVDSRAELNGHWHSLVARARARESGGVGYELLATLRTGQTVWRQWWHTTSAGSRPWQKTGTQPGRES